MRNYLCSVNLSQNIEFRRGGFYIRLFTIAVLRQMSALQKLRITNFALRIKKALTFSHKSDTMLSVDRIYQLFSRNTHLQSRELSVQVSDGRGVAGGTKSFQKLAVQFLHPAEMHNRSFSFLPICTNSTILRR